MARLKISTDKLLLIAGAIWAVAGANILNLGLIAYGQDWGTYFVWLLLGTAAIFSLFHFIIFGNMVRKHEKRIRSIVDKKSHILKFLDTKGYIIMTVMMGGGISLRAFHLVPEWFIAFFYTGLGAALVLAGSLFIVHYFKKAPQGKTSSVVS